MRLLFTIAFSAILSVVFAQQIPAVSAAESKNPSPAIPANNGLAKYDFFYTGGNKPLLSMYIIKNGKVAWSYTHPANGGGIGDAELLPDGSVLFAHQLGVTKVSVDKKVLWNYAAPAGTEIHTAQSIGNEHVMFVQNGVPAKFIVVNIKSGKIAKQFELPTNHPQRVHSQFRHARITGAGTVLIAHMADGKVVEYDVDGNALWTVEVPAPYAATPLKNGNILVSSGKEKTVTEINRKGETVWKLSQDDLPGYVLTDIQVSYQMSNGHYLCTNRSNKGDIQAIEVDKNKKVFWVLRSWDEPADLGKATIIQFLSTPYKKVKFGNLK